MNSQFIARLTFEYLCLIIIFNLYELLYQRASLSSSQKHIATIYALHNVFK